MTVCKKGSTMWPTLQAFIEGQRLNVREMRSTEKAHLRLRWLVDIETFSWDSGSKVEPVSQQEKPGRAGERTA